MRVQSEYTLKHNCEGLCVSRSLRTQLNVQCYVYGTTINVRVRVGAMCARCPMLS